MAAPKHLISVRCWDCGRVSEIGSISGALPECCFDTLTKVAGALGSEVISQLPYHQERIVQNHLRFNDAIADAAVTSPNPEVRKAAQDWRNSRAAKKSEG